MGFWKNHVRTPKRKDEDVSDSKSRDLYSHDLISRVSLSISSKSRSPPVISPPTNFVHVDHALPTTANKTFEPLQLQIHKSANSLKPIAISGLSDQNISIQEDSQDANLSPSSISTTPVVRKPLARIATVVDLDRMISSLPSAASTAEVPVSTSRSLTNAIYIERAVNAMQESDKLDRQLKNLQDRIDETRTACELKELQARNAVIKRTLEAGESRSPSPVTLHIPQIIEPKASPLARPGYNRQHTFGALGTPAPLSCDTEEETYSLASPLGSPSPMTVLPRTSRPIFFQPPSPLPQIVLAPSINAARPPLEPASSSDHVQNWLLNSTPSPPSREIEVEASDIFGKDASASDDRAEKSSVFSYAVRGSSIRGSSARWSVMSDDDDSHFTLEPAGTPALLSDLDDDHVWQDTTFHRAESITLYHISMSAKNSQRSIISRSSSAPALDSENEDSQATTSSPPDSPTSLFQENENTKEWEDKVPLKTHATKAFGMFDFTEERRGSFGQLLTGGVVGEEHESGNVGIAF